MYVDRLSKCHIGNQQICETQGMRRKARHVLSEENLARLRPGARITPPKTSPGSSTFQEELMRLIDPDLSFAASDNTPTRDDSGLSYRSGRLQRTQSDESICGTVSIRPRHAPIDSSTGDVLFTTAKPARAKVKRSPEGDSNKDKTPSRAHTDDLPPMFRVRRTTSPGSSARHKVPLVEGSPGLDWRQLVDVARNFTETSDLSTNKSTSMGAISTASNTTAGSRPQAAAISHSHMGLKASKSSELHKGAAPCLRGESPGGHSKDGNERRRRPSGERSGSRDRGTGRGHSVSWRNNTNSSQSSSNGPIDSLQRVQELEARVMELEEALDREQEVRISLETENSALLQENARLQEESSKAAAQLRKFTEWFFNNIDHQ